MAVGSSELVTAELVTGDGGLPLVWESLCSSGSIMKWTRRTVFSRVLCGALLLGVGGFATRGWIADQRGVGATLRLPQSPIELPVTRYGGHLYLRGQLNQSEPEWLFLDTGAADMFVNAPYVQKLGLQPWSSWLVKSGPQSVRDVTFHLGPLALRDRRTDILPTHQVQTVADYLGRPFAGIVGHEFFQNLVVEVDPRRPYLRLHDPAQYRYQGQGQRLPMAIQGDRPYVSVTVTPYGHPPMQGRLLVDVGSNGALAVAAGCQLDQLLIGKVPQTLERPVISISGPRTVTLGRVQSVTLGTVTIPQPLTVFTAAPQQDCATVVGKIGNQILDQFRVIFDYSRETLILEPLVPLDPQDDYRYDLSGLWLWRDRTLPDALSIRRVFPNTPAATAGIQAGDELIAVDDVPLTPEAIATIRMQLSQPNTAPQLTIRRRSQVLTYSLPLRPLL